MIINKIRTDNTLFQIKITEGMDDQDNDSGYEEKVMMTSSNHDR